jgi:hypothetical protein
MTVSDREERARGSFERQLWRDAFTGLSAAHRDGLLGAEDLERLAIAAYMVGKRRRLRRCVDGRAPRVVNPRRSRPPARCAFLQALGLFFRGDVAPAMGWVARGGRLLENDPRDCVEQAWLRMLKALPLLFEGDADAAYPRFVEAGEIAERFGARTFPTTVSTSPGRSSGSCPCPTSRTRSARWFG